MTYRASTERTNVMKTAISCRLSTFEQRYNCHLDQSVQHESTFKEKDYVFIDHSAQTVIASDVPDELARCKYRKLLQRASTLYKGLRFLRHTAEKAQDDKPELVLSMALRCHPHKQK